MRYTSRFFADLFDQWEFNILWEGGSDGETGGELETQFIELRPLTEKKPWLWVLHYMQKNLAQVERKKQHSISVTDFLLSARKEGRLHSIFDCVHIFGKKRRYYIGRSIPGIAWSHFHIPWQEGMSDFESLVFDVVKRILERNLRDLHITASKMWFDIDVGNMLLNRTFCEFLIQQNERKKLENIEFVRPVKLAIQEENEFLTQWAAAGARIYLFDFGTWKLPK